ncbi:nucleotidyl transferase AbiEii/AbiGii toxin family protein [Reyranella sp.]|uniref:nucleotidyl transferase AbiEii/AbiGii toxin family protein n=1 Tax=Reyranella sp. TaxID=1929291 RepID=UPI002725FF0F|nr:nucleotidyl transferase AbiEii/AbiGii toxin family protein [Reyranella sp.]MDO8975047.1 nucleotidyl transferase AbiEii/AbiGii toxin family protein [Reyranella sp.]
MNAFLALPAPRRQLAFQQVDETMGLQAVSVEKDFWVCWTLRELFTLPDIGNHLTFKGGTSLSKAWKFIQRFSEDIDLVVDKDVLSFAGDAAPDRAPSSNQRKARLEKLMDACRAWVQGRLQPALAARITEALGGPGWTLEVDSEMPDGQCLLFHYPSVFAAGTAGYVRPVVKIELGARSDDWPGEGKSIQPYVIEQFPALDRDAAFNVRVLAAERTFWEKACLLHEETFRPADKPRKLRMARHYYDLWCLLRAGVGDRALADTALFQRVAEHRELFFRYTWVDYDTHRPGTFRLSPPADQLADWREDYRQMLGPMFFGDTPTFEDMMTAVTAFEKTFNGTV